MKNFSIKIALLLALGFSPNLKIWAKKPPVPPPNWTVKASDFQYSMNVLARVKVGGAFNNASQNMVGVFAGLQLRGVASPLVLGGDAYFFITVYANSYLGEQLSFRLYLAADDKIYASSSSLVFQHNGWTGVFATPFLVDVSPALSISTTTLSPTCFGNANGTIFSTILGGTPPYTYLWSNGKTTKDINLLTAGTYTLTVTSTGGATATKTTVLTQPDAINFAVNFVANPPGYDANFVASGGLPGYLYNRTGMVSTDFRVASDPIFDHLAANTSFVFKLKDANGCQKSLIKKTPTTAPQRVHDVALPRDFADETSAPQVAAALLVFPNPAGEVLNVQFFFSENVENAQPPGDGTISVFDPLGRLVFSKILSENLWLPDSPVFQIPLKNLPSGCYSLVFRGRSGGIFAERVFVEN